MSSNATASNRRFEQGIVAFFILMPPIGGLVVLWHSLQDLPKFGMTIGWLAYLIALVGAHIKWVRPKFRRYPWVASYKEIAERSKPLKAKHPKLVQKALNHRILRSIYRIGFFVALLPFFIGMYSIHHEKFVWFFGMWLVAGFGITIGYHRVGTHPSFKTSPVMRGIFFAMGSMAIQGPPSEWMKKHSKHHAFGETTADVHTPYVFEESKRAIFMEQFNGFMHSFVMWAFREPSLRRPKGMSIEEWKADLISRSPDPATFRYRDEDRHHWEVRNEQGEIVVSTETLIKKRWARFVDVIAVIEQDAVVTFMSHPLVYLSVLFLSFAIPYYLGGISVWESLARACFVNWVTFCVNSVCHLWGEVPFEVPDNSRNNAVIEILALGEGGHNTHHKSELWAQHGVFGWQFDPGAVVIKTLTKVGLAHEPNLPTRQQIVKAWLKWRTREPWMQGLPLTTNDLIQHVGDEHTSDGFLARKLRRIRKSESPEQVVEQILKIVDQDVTAEKRGQLVTACVDAGGISALQDEESANKMIVTVVKAMAV
ncbi:MAG: acyl-CoA desaturase [Armatimonadetes bacterium]|nr:acyl-CoA desaturase [Armatimonadota bacterium]